MSLCLITGASGFVGSNLAATLSAQGRNVRCVVRGTSDTSRLEALEAEICRGSLEDRDFLSRAVADVDAVFHVAGCTAAFHARQYRRVNVDASRRLAEVCAAREKPPVFIFVSSLAAGGPATDDQPRSENDCDQPVSTYGRSKLSAELEIVKLADRLPISIVRPPIIFGPADRASLNLYQTLRYSRLHPLPGFRQFSVSLVYIADLCDGLILVADRGSRATPDDPLRGTYYVAADRAVSYPEFGKLAGQAAGWSAWPVPIPKALFWIVGACGELVGRLRRQPVVLNLDKIREATAPGWVCTDAKIRSELGYQPRAPLEQRFAETVQWYRDHGWL